MNTTQSHFHLQDIYFYKSELKFIFKSLKCEYSHTYDSKLIRKLDLAWHQFEQIESALDEFIDKIVHRTALSHELLIEMSALSLASCSKEMFDKEEIDQIAFKLRLAKENLFEFLFSKKESNQLNTVEE